ncbi:hypothetical protein KY290_000830 [Solanum tuberosum]|uniref:Uncharacterized protein n=1 Tax=Solanum tuberosum TaxID=4113 RepID=A0ABQ7WMM8_SOLTU|nr:hypothetical protein KY290_000830 [Solanum tuberosum]
MLIDTPQSPPPTHVVAATSLRRMEKYISFIVNATLLVDDDQVSNQHNISSSSTGRGTSRATTTGGGGGGGDGGLSMSMSTL